MENKFNKDDKQKLVDFLNVVAEKATFTLNTKEVIIYFKLLSHLQNVILPKLDENILEVSKIIEDKQD